MLTAWVCGLLLAQGEIDPRVLPPGVDRGRQLSQDARARIRAANDRESEAWRKIKTREEWEAYRDARLKALRESLGAFPPVPADLKVRVTRTLEGDGHRIENLVFESRPGLVVTANLYVPAAPTAAMPGILICHSHHNSKTQGELQDMGMTWARQGCLVLVMDQLGHGERRQHPFGESRQDYRFRYVVGMQLQAIGESLTGWMAWDMMRGVDLLHARPGIDKERIILLGAVAGGGDPAAVTAALDPRITMAVPFNFGGPQPETTYPLPEDAEAWFNYAGSGSWESTRNLSLSARDGFLPWVIVGSIAPRRLVYGHEFAWDRERDPVWKRLGAIYDFYGARDRLSAAMGRGGLSGKPPEATHCNNIGPEHRKGIYAALERGFGMAPPAKEFQERRSAAELACLTPEIKVRPVRELAAAWKLPAPADLRREWSRLLGDVAPADAKVVTVAKDRVGVERIALEVEPGIDVPLILLLPAQGRAPIVVGVAQEGKRGFLKERSEAVTALLNAGIAVALPDLRGTGETRPGDGRGRSSGATSISSTDLMLGRPLVGSRLKDLRSVLRYLRSRADVDGTRIALWGDSFTQPYDAGENLSAPLEGGESFRHAEPLGAILALLGALFEPDVRAALARGGLEGYYALLESPFCYVPHDALVPGAVTIGDLPAVAKALAPRPVRVESQVDAQNRRVAGSPSSDAASIARWLAEQLAK